MGTRGLYGFRYRGIDKTTYNHYDSYPEYLGTKMTEYCANHDVETMKKIYDNIYLVDVNSKPTRSEILMCTSAGWCDTDVDGQTRNDWYCLLRNTQGKLECYDNYNDGMLPMRDSHEFILDSLFCEYAYIINLDEEVLEFWVGFQTDPWDGNRYGNTAEDGYYPCALRYKIPLDQITSEKVDTVVQILEGKADEIEDNSEIN